MATHERRVGLPVGPLGVSSPPLVSGTGAWFDTLNSNVQPSHIRTWAHDWLVWGEESLKELSRIRRAALSGMGSGTEPWEDGIRMHMHAHVHVCICVHVRLARRPDATNYTILILISVSMLAGYRNIAVASAYIYSYSY